MAAVGRKRCRSIPEIDAETWRPPVFVEDAETLRADPIELGNRYAREEFNRRAGERSTHDISPLPSVMQNTFPFLDAVRTRPSALKQQEGALVAMILTAMQAVPDTDWVCHGRFNVKPEGHSSITEQFTLGVLSTMNQYGFIPLPTAHTWKYPGMTALLNAYLYLKDPAFQASNIQVTKNLKTSPHVDVNNSGPSWIVGFGKYKGGETCFEDDGGDKFHRLTGDVKVRGKVRYAARQRVRCTAVDIKRKMTMFDGNKLHFTMQFEGERFGVVYFLQQRGLGKIPALIQGYMEGLGFRLPSLKCEAMPPWGNEMVKLALVSCRVKDEPGRPLPPRPHRAAVVRQEERDATTSSVVAVATAATLKLEPPSSDSELEMSVPSWGRVCSTNPVSDFEMTPPRRQDDRGWNTPITEFEMTPTIQEEPPSSDSEFEMSVPLWERAGSTTPVSDFEMTPPRRQDDRGLNSPIMEFEMTPPRRDDRGLEFPLAGFEVTPPRRDGRGLASLVAESKMTLPRQDGGGFGTPIAESKIPPPTQESDSYPFCFQTPAGRQPSSTFVTPDAPLRCPPSLLWAPTRSRRSTSQNSEPPRSRSPSSEGTLSIRPCIPAGWPRARRLRAFSKCEWGRHLFSSPSQETVGSSCSPPLPMHTVAARRSPSWARSTCSPLQPPLAARQVAGSETPRPRSWFTDLDSSPAAERGMNNDDSS